MNKINVAFRKFEDGEVIAIFPDIKEGDNEVLSYMHIGQHSACSVGLMDELDKANENEYFSLKKELENIGYSINVI